MPSFSYEIDVKVSFDTINEEMLWNIHVSYLLSLDVRETRNMYVDMCALKMPLRVGYGIFEIKVELPTLDEWYMLDRYKTIWISCTST